MAQSGTAHAGLGGAALRRTARTPTLTAALVVLAVVAAVGWAWWQQQEAPRSAGPSPTWTPRTPEPAALDPRYDQARTMLDALPVKGWDRVQDFKRHRFGERWSDDVTVEFGHNGCNTRDDILRRDLTRVELRRGTCLVQRGVLHDPYSGNVIEFVRGPETSEAVQIDHLVALADAWYKGARSWDDARRRDFANDPRNLLAVGAQANFDKAFRDAAGWLPANAAFECEFVSRQITVKNAYGLWVSANEKTAMQRVLRRC
ncbi:HNH endonuclease family protein [[Mycobacterium] kokjensenii]|uniref:HNH endonuclease family protein n=1 Tax=[Mycobacterium] kokjensenii TaxID=3064287 RepID=A0ABN9NEI0_9MYCO|nr:HNH endonuclease family protein [Mycolicibacter sp. MU0083]CAJ1505080.1 HNH endonuclease family protein [Mycolicibacter sp. MU0083]